MKKSSLSLTFFMMILFVFAIINTQPGDLKLLSIKGKTMGTYYSVKFYGRESDKKVIQQRIDSRLEKFNNTFSTYIKNSEISQINNNLAGTYAISEDMRFLIELSKDINKKSLGHFDISVGPLVNAWGFGPNGKRNKPSNELIKELKNFVGDQHFTLSANQLNKSKDELFLDMSAVAKGYGVDMILSYLKSIKIESALVEVGGEVRSFGTKVQPNSPWVVGVEKPSVKLGTAIQKVVYLDNNAMATSGSYRNYIKYGDSIFTHTINPRTFKPVNHKLVSASVISDTCAKADAWATAFMAMGEVKALELANKLKIKLYMLIKTDTGFTEKSSKEFNNYMKKGKL